MKTKYIVYLSLAGVIAIAAWTYSDWSPIASEYVGLTTTKAVSPDDPHGHAGDDSHAHTADEPHAHTADVPPEEVVSDSHSGEDSLHLSPEARENIGLTTDVVQRGDFTRSVSVPAVVVERPGHSQIEITAPMTGLITTILIQEGLSQQPGEALFNLRLTHEDVVSSQRDFLKYLQERDVIQREIDRLKKIGNDVIPERRVIEQQYLFDKAEASIKALKQSLILHGLSSEQVDTIAQSRNVLKEVSVFAPPHETPLTTHAAKPSYHVQEINVNRGQSVLAGQRLGALADHSLLFVQGRAFEEDTQRLITASNSDRLLKVVPVSGKSLNPLELKVLFVADHIDRESRALNFYLLLPNERVDARADERVEEGFVSWRFRPGQRMQVQLPTDQSWEDQVVLPPEAVAIEGPNAFVFKQRGDHFERVEVHVLYRDKNRIVIEDDGRLVGSTLAMSGAYEMHLALKNQAGGGVDPHAGHSH